MKVISCLIDFTETSKIAVAYAVALAKRHAATLNLLHVIDDDSTSDQEVEQRLITFTSIAEMDVAYSVSVSHGHYMKMVPKQLQLSGSDLVVIGTHGTKGIFQTLFGANVLKLVQEISVSALVVQDHSPRPPSDIKNILFPLAPHQNFSVKIDQTAKWAKSWNAEVDVFCLFKGDDALPHTISKNLDLTKKTFEEQGVKYKATLQDSQVYSVGYARDILTYAEDKNFDLLVIMAHNSDENAYFGNVDKTNLILNTKGIPVLCTH